MSTEYCPNFTLYMSPPAPRTSVAHFVNKHWFLSCILDFSWLNHVFLGSYSITPYSQLSKSGFFMVQLLLCDFLTVVCCFWRLKTCPYLFLMIAILLFPHRLFPVFHLSCSLYFNVHSFTHSSFCSISIFVELLQYARHHTRKAHKNIVLTLMDLTMQ